MIGRRSATIKITCKIYQKICAKTFLTIFFLHFFTFKTPTEWAELSEKRCTGCASSMRNGVKGGNSATFHPNYK